MTYHPVATRPVRVEIDDAKFWKLARMQPVHMNISVLEELRKNGIPVDGGVEFRAVKHGSLTMHNEQVDGKRICVYEWAPGRDSEDDEL